MALCYYLSHTQGPNTVHDTGVALPPGLREEDVTGSVRRRCCISCQKLCSSGCWHGHVLSLLFMKPVDLHAGQPAAGCSETELSVPSALGWQGGVWASFHAFTPILISVGKRGRAVAAHPSQKAAPRVNDDLLLVSF